MSDQKHNDYNNDSTDSSDSTDYSDSTKFSDSNEFIDDNDECYNDNDEYEDTIDNYMELLINNQQFNLDYLKDDDNIINSIKTILFDNLQNQSEQIDIDNNNLLSMYLIHYYIFQNNVNFIDLVANTYHKINLEYITFFILNILNYHYINIFKTKYFNILNQEFIEYSQYYHNNNIDIVYQNYNNQSQISNHILLTNLIDKTGNYHCILPFYHQFVINLPDTLDLLKHILCFNHYCTDKEIQKEINNLIGEINLDNLDKITNNNYFYHLLHLYVLKYSDKENNNYDTSIKLCKQNLTNNNDNDIINTIINSYDINKYNNKLIEFTFSTIAHEEVFDFYKNVDSNINYYINSNLYENIFIHNQNDRNKQIYIFFIYLYNMYTQYIKYANVKDQILYDYFTIIYKLDDDYNKYKCIAPTSNWIKNQILFNLFSILIQYNTFNNSTFTDNDNSFEYQFITYLKAYNSKKQIQINNLFQFIDYKYDDNIITIYLDQIIDLFETNFFKQNYLLIITCDKCQFNNNLYTYIDNNKSYKKIKESDSHTCDGKLTINYPKYYIIINEQFYNNTFENIINVEDKQYKYVTSIYYNDYNDTYKIQINKSSDILNNILLLYELQSS